MPRVRTWFSVSRGLSFLHGHFFFCKSRSLCGKHKILKLLKKVIMRKNQNIYIFFLATMVQQAWHLLRKLCESFMGSGSDSHVSETNFIWLIAMGSYLGRAAATAAAAAPPTVLVIAVAAPESPAAPTDCRTAQADPAATLPPYEDMIPAAADPARMPPDVNPRAVTMPTTAKGAKIAPVATPATA